MSDQTPAHRPLEAIQQDLCAGPGETFAGAYQYLHQQRLCNELIAAVRAERPSSVHLDRGMVEKLRYWESRQFITPVLVQGEVARRLGDIADAIEASLAPQTPEAAPDPVLYPIRGTIQHLALKFHRQVEGETGCPGLTCPGVQRLVEHFFAAVGIGIREDLRAGRLAALGLPVSLAPVEGRPNELPKRDVSALVETLRIRALALTGEQWERTATTAMMKESADQLERLEADLSRLTLEYRVHMRNITEGEAARKAEVEKLRDTARRLVVERDEYRCGTRHVDTHPVSRLQLPTGDGVPGNDYEALTHWHRIACEALTEVSRLKAEQEGK